MNISRYYHTIKHLKPIQLYFQLKYRVRNKVRHLTGFKYPLSIPAEGNPITLKSFIPKSESYNDETFTFLNRSKKFTKKIDWQFAEFGKLWTYNLNYFDFLNQEDIDTATSFDLILDFLDNLKYPSTALEPYPVSLRGINWIKFISGVTQRTPREKNHAANAARKTKIDTSLNAQYKILLDNLEYHLLGNHLLENGFSLLIGAYYFNDSTFYLKSKEILINELTEQILEDGGHFELSPMYHQIILDRLLDSINLIQNNKRFHDERELLDFMLVKAGKMLSWLKQMTFSNGDIPLFNDATINIAPTSKQLFEYANRLGLVAVKGKVDSVNRLGVSGYRRFNGKKYECIVDVADIGPDYIPGHAHADMLSFVLYVDGKPVIIDPGISTYEKNEQRQLERSTFFHNTVVVDGKNQSDVWGGFRVGKRGRIKILKDNKNIIAAEHNSYKPLIHKRVFLFNQKSIKINDILSGTKAKGQSYLHFHPERKITLRDNKILIDNKIIININNASLISLINYKCPLGYNRYSNAKKVIIDFKDQLEYQIET